TIRKTFGGDEVFKDRDLAGGNGALSITRRVFMLREDCLVRVDAEDHAVVGEVIHEGQNLAWAILFQHFRPQLLLAFDEPVETNAAEIGILPPARNESFVWMPSP